MYKLPYAASKVTQSSHIIHNSYLRVILNRPGHSLHFHLLTLKPELLKFQNYGRASQIL